MPSLTHNFAAAESRGGELFSEQLNLSANDFGQRKNTIPAFLRRQAYALKAANLWFKSQVTPFLALPQFNTLVFARVSLESILRRIGDKITENAIIVTLFITLDLLSINTQKSLATDATEVDLLAALLADKRSPNTKQAYAKDLRDFFSTTMQQQPTKALVSQFLQLGRYDAISLVLRYKATLMERGLAESTVNRRLAAIKSLVNYAHRVGKCDWSLQDIQGEKVKTYRDTTGVDRDAYRRVLSIPDRDTLKGKRDYALLRLLWENVLRRGEVVRANVGDFNPQELSLMIYGKGQGTQAQRVSLSQPTVAAILDWLQARGSRGLPTNLCKSGQPLNPTNPLCTDRLSIEGCPDLQRFPSRQEQPLFIALDRASLGLRLSGTGLFKIVQTTCKSAGIQKPMSPHRVRHSGITEALEITGGDVRAVQKLSRHAKLETLMIYDDARANAQQKVTDLLASIL